MIKKNLYFASLFFVCLGVLLGISSISYAAMDETQLLSDLQKLGEGGAIGTYVYENISLPSDLLQYNSYIICIGQGQQNDSGVTSRADKLSTTTYLYICGTNNTSVGNYSSDKNNALYYCWSISGTTKIYNYQTGAYVSGTSSPAFNNLLAPYYIYTQVDINTRKITLASGEEYGGSYLTQRLEYSPVYNEIVTVDDYNGVYAMKLGYVNQNVIIGQFDQYLEDYPIIHTYLYDQNSNIIAENKYNINLNTNTSSNFFINSSNNKISIATRLINYNYIYSFVCYAETLSGVRSSDSIVINYIFLPYNAVINNGTIVSPRFTEIITHKTVQTILSTILQILKMLTILLIIFSLEILLVLLTL